MKMKTFPIRLDDNTLSEVKTLLECGEITGQDIPDDLLEAIIN